MSLQDLEAGGGTSLTNAMMNAINQLKYFSNCVRLAVLLYCPAHNLGRLVMV